MDDAAALIRAYLDAFNRGNRPAMLALLAEDIAHDVNQGGREVGRDAFAAFMARMDRCYRERLADIVVMATPDGRRAAAEFTVIGEYLATDDGLPPAQGQRYVLPAGAFYDLHDGRITRVTMHYNLADWQAQVGPPTEPTRHRTGPRLIAVHPGALELDLPDDVIGRCDVQILDEEAPGVGVSIEYLGTDEATAFALFVNCRPTIGGEAAMQTDPQTALSNAIAALRRMGHTADGSIRMVKGLPAVCTTSSIEGVHSEDLSIVVGGRLFQAHCTSADPALARAGMMLAEDRLLPQFLDAAPG